MSNLPTWDENVKRPTWGDGYGDYGCRVNCIDVRQLFQWYERGGFLYPDKRDRLLPYWSEIEDNWRRMLRGGELLLWIVTHDDPVTGAWATTSSWRSTNTGWQTQHTVSLGGPTGSRAVLLAAQAVRIRDGFDSSHQCWFSPTNRFAQKIFGSILRSLDERQAASLLYSYLAVPLTAGSAEHGVRIVPCQQGPSPQLLDLVLRTRGAVYADSEQIVEGDLALAAVDSLYQRVGLRRTRRVWLAFIPGHERAVGAVLAYRGPLGLNFSFLENRCDLMLRPGLSAAEANLTTRALLHAVAPAYADFRPGFIPVVTDEQRASLVLALGAQQLRTYAQSIWLQAGYEAMYRHMESLYSRIEQAERRRKAQRWTLPAPRVALLPSETCPPTAAPQPIEPLANLG